eukprot:m51a1_g7394 hypothetical protein (67) ;mRNA; r:148989-153267
MQALSDDVLAQVLCQLARCSGADSCVALGRASLVCRHIANTFEDLALTIDCINGNTATAAAGFIGP